MDRYLLVVFLCFTKFTLSSSQGKVTSEKSRWERGEASEVNSDKRRLQFLELRAGLFKGVEITSQD